MQIVEKYLRTQCYLHINWIRSNI